MNLNTITEIRPPSSDGLKRGFAVAPGAFERYACYRCPSHSHFRRRKLGAAEGKCAKLLGGSMGRPPFHRGRARRQLPRDKIGMAINSAASRSQDQRHIHVACIAPEFLRRHQAEIHEAWSFPSSALLGHRFAAMKVETDSLVDVDPFKLLARGLPSGKFSVGSQILAVIGATFGGGRIGFYLGQRVWCIAAENRKRGSTA